MGSFKYIFLDSDNVWKKFLAVEILENHYT